MRRNWIYCLIMTCVSLMICTMGICADKVSKKKQTRFSTEDEKICYALGYNLTMNIKKVYAVHPEILFKGIKDAVSGSGQMSHQEILKNINQFSKAMAEKAQQERTKAISENKAKGIALMTANKKNKKIVTLESGLQYEILKAGKGKSPGPEDTVKCHYKGNTIDGNVFDSSYARKEPMTFSVKKVIKGFSQALQLMKPGAKWKVYIPQDLAYGERVVDNSIPPGSTLIFEIELLEVNPKK